VFCCGGFIPFTIVDTDGGEVDGWTDGGAGFVGALPFFFSIR
jgi:hypothetical protein